MNTNLPQPLASTTEGAQASSLFSGGFLASLVIAALRYFFQTYGQDLAWNSDPTKSGIEIDTVNNFHDVTIGPKPRILIDRGQYGMSSSGLTDNMAEQKNVGLTKGLTDRINFVLYTGQIDIYIQSRQEGTCERVTDLAQHFLVWSAPYLCNTQGFKQFAKSIVVGPCTPSSEDVEIFQVQISTPWVKEESWRVFNDGITIKGIDLLFSS